MFFVPIFKVYNKVEMSTTKNLVFSFMYLVSVYPMDRTKDCKNMQEIGPFLLVDSSKNYQEILCIFLQFLHQISMRNIVKCWKYFFWYSITL